MSKILTFNQILTIVNKEIDDLDWKREPYGLYEPIKYILSLGGKRIRPVITLMAANLFTDKPEQVINQAMALEIFHNFTLLHDDIMDRADVRRGKPTVHKKWDDNTAILSGDVMQIEAYKWIAKTPAQHLQATLDLFSTTAAEICEGQQYDMEFESRSEVLPDEYIEMIRLKTAVLMAAGCQIGAQLCGANTKNADLLYNFGSHIGLAFQLKDDLLDVYGDTETFGKKIGGDILCNKKTFLLIHALRNSTNDDRTELLGWLANNNPADEEKKIEAVRNLYDKLGVRQICEDKMMEFYNLAVQSLDLVEVDENKKRELRKLANALIDRMD